MSTGADITIYADQSLPATAITWLEADGDAIHFHTGYTFRVELVDEDGYLRLTKTTGITGSQQAPNITITWTAADVDDLAGLYRMRLVAIATDGARRVFRPDSPPVVWVRPVPAAPPSV